MGMRASLCTECIAQPEPSPMRQQAAELLKRAHIPTTEPDITTLAKDLELVHYERGLDCVWKRNYSAPELLLSRIGGIGALSRYLSTIRPTRRGK
jgi:hypothetical protein